MKYRPDVDGLRAIAVLSVVLYHAGLWPFTGGFIGVDVFFVISGYLITSIIHHDISVGQFTIAGFYARRIRRILPALLATVAASAIAASYILLPDDFDAFGDSVAATALAASNFLFWRDQAYFATASEAKPLLHTWSLGVEEQFYVLFPILLVLLGKHQKRVTLVLAGTAVLSFCVAAWSVSKAPQAAFFLLPSRAWELMLGALLALGAIPALKDARSREVAAAAGLLLIGVGTVAYSAETPFPGVAALLPCLGAGLVIHTGASGSSWVGSALGLRPIVFIGLISYSLYLWHWPILVFARYLNVVPLNGWQTAGVAVASFVAAVLSWALVERPFRRQGGHPTVALRWGLATIGGMAVAGAAIMAADGLPSRYDAATLRYIAMLKKENFYDIYDRGNCFLDYDQRAAHYNPADCLPDSSKHGRPRVLIWGDSFAAHLYPGVKAVLKERGAEVGQYTATSCRPLPQEKGRCAEMYRSLPDFLVRSAPMDAIIISSFWEPYVRRLGEDDFRARLTESIGVAKRYSRQVILVGQSPTFGQQVPLTPILKPTTRNDEQLLLPGREYRAVNDLLASIAQETGAKFYDPLSDGCDNLQCLAMLKGEPLHWDNAHLTLTGSIFYAGKLVRLLDLPLATAGNLKRS